MGGLHSPDPGPSTGEQDKQTHTITPLSLSLSFYLPSDRVLMLLLVLLVLLSPELLVSAQDADATATTEYITPTPEVYGDHHRPYFFNHHPNICGRIPTLKQLDPNGVETWDYASATDQRPNILYLSEAHCGTCQSVAGIAGMLVDRWQMFQYDDRRLDQYADVDVVVINRDSPKSRAKFRMMTNRINNYYRVKQHVELVQDSANSGLWNTLGDYINPFGGKFGDQEVAFRAKKNDMYLVDRWGRMIRFMREGILGRTRKNSASTSLHWRDIMHHDFVLERAGETVCDEIQKEQLLCHNPTDELKDWSLNGVYFRNLRAGSALTFILFIRADLPEYTTDGALRDLIALTQDWDAPNYVVIVDSHPRSMASFATVDLFRQSQGAGKTVNLLLDEENTITSRYMAAPGDLFACDESGRILGSYNRVDLTDRNTVEELKMLHVQGNPDCDAYTNIDNWWTGPSWSPSMATSAPYYTGW